MCSNIHSFQDFCNELIILAISSANSSKIERKKTVILRILNGKSFGKLAKFLFLQHFQSYYIKNISTSDPLALFRSHDKNGKYEVTSSKDDYRPLIVPYCYDYTLYKGG